MRPELEREVKRSWQKVRRDIEPEIRAKVAVQPLMDADLAVAVVVTQNVMRDAITAAIAQALPQGREFFVEMAVRTACYFLTAMDPDDQEVGALRARAGLLNKLADMQAAGHTIQTEWK